MQFAIWDFLSTEGFQPHGVCLLWRSDVFWAHVISDAVIALSYFSIPAALLYLISRRSDLMYRWVFYLFCAFIVACGVTHVFGIWTLWVPDYGVQAVMKLLTAAVSLATATSLWPLMPRLLALPSAGQLAQKNAALAHEISERQSAEDRLQRLNEDLERRVAERTRSLEEANLALTESRAAAEQANRAKSDFLAMMSHELRTPLNAIIGFSDMLRSRLGKASDAENTTQYAAYIHESGQHLLDLINDILDLSKIESGKVEVSRSWIDVGALLPAVINLTKPMAERTGVRLRLDAPEDAPQLFADPRRLKQILVNLLANAVKFTPAGGEVVLRAGHEPMKGYTFQVVDTGIGIAPEDLPRIFMPFQQANVQHSRGHEGTGLGLPLTKALVEMHGGHLTLDSHQGEGTTATVVFPLNQPAAAAAGPGTRCVAAPVNCSPEK